LTNHTQPKRMPGPSARRIRQYPGLGNALGSSDLRVLGPEASTRELHQKNHGELQNQKSETLCEWSPTGEYSQRVVVPISSEPAPSHRPWTFASGATPARTTPTYHRVNRKPGKIGTFYLAGNRNFLLGLDTSLVAGTCQFAFHRKARRTTVTALKTNPPKTHDSNLCLVVSGLTERPCL